MSDGDAGVKPAARRRGPRGIRTDSAALRRRRIGASLTLDELAKATDSTKGHLSQIENGKYNASPELLSRLAAALGCDVTDLIAENGNGGEAA